MKKILSFCSALAVTSAALAYNPVANPDAVVEAGKARFTVLTPEMIRIEYSPAGRFEDKATFTVLNRELPVPDFKTSKKGNTLTITTSKLKLNYRLGTDPVSSPSSPENLNITMSVNGEQVEWYPGKSDSLNLRGTYRTLDRNHGDQFRPLLEQGLVSRSGWAVVDDSPRFRRCDGSRSLALMPHQDGIDWVCERADSAATDIYFLGYGHEYKRALKDYTAIAGKIPLPPDYVFGYWYSKYEDYTAEDFRNIVKALKDNDINTDVLILDMDWHWNGSKETSGGRGRWTGWSWNTNLIPDPQALLDDIHDAGLHISLNLHPAQGVYSDEDCFAGIARDMGLDKDTVKSIPWQLEHTGFKEAFFSHFIRPMEKMGVDFWWLDWQQHLTSPYVDGLGETFWCNHVFFNDMKQNRPDRRPLIFHRWGGLGSHRYQIGFSGDAAIDFPTLAFETYFTSTASNVCYGYWGHDLGGHNAIKGTDVNDPELLLRWLQFGVFTPIFRTHATKGRYINRMLWTYDNFPQLNQAVKLRYAIFPYLYTAAREAYDTGVSICRPLYYEYPEQEEAYKYETEYFFGPDILCAPVVERSKNGISRSSIWIPEGQWWSAAHNRLIEGGSVQDMEFTLDQIPYFYRLGSIVPNNPPEVKSTTERPKNLILNVIAGKDGEGTLYEDSGDSNNYDTEFATTRFCQKYNGRKGTYVIEARKGSSDRLQPARSYQMRIYNTGEPRKAKIAGMKSQPAVSYDPEKRCTTITVPEHPCDKDVKIEVEYKQL